MTTKSARNTEAHPAVIRLKRLAGIVYGVIGGLTFALATWGWDGYRLSQAHVYLPWLSLSVALVFCAIGGAAAGWLTARFDSSLLGVLFWLIAALSFAWLVIVLPLQINPFLVSKINPQMGALLNYTKEIEMSMRFSVAASWIIPFMLIAGVAQLPVTESSVFSTSFFGKTMPLVFCIAVISLSGAVADGLINAHFRDAVISMDNTIQFTLDNKDNPKVDKDISRKMHSASLNTVKEYVAASRQLMVREYDPTFGEINVLIRFEDKWVDCLLIYAQPVFCKVAD
ncbi:MAG: hypothetical protein PHQ36_00045 [Anaerolineales bacterium]|nr:hypothetical protein [Anaerolineales bacterium]